MSEHVYGCRWCPAEFYRFAELPYHVRREHPAEYERAIQRPSGPKVLNIHTHQHREPRG